MTGSGGSEEATALLTAVLINRSVADVDHFLSDLTHPDAAVDADGITALMLASKNANLALVELLLRRGASVNLVETARGRTAIMFAIKTGNHELVDRLAASSFELNLLTQDIDGCTALMLAAQYGHCGIVETLLRHSEAIPGQCRALVDISNKLGQTALHDAAKRGHVAIAAALIFAGAAVDASDRWFNRPLHYAALHGHTTVVALLASRPSSTVSSITAVRSADVNAANQAGKTAFHYAAANGYSWIVVDVLLRYDAEMEQFGTDSVHSERRFDPDRPDNMGNTALMLAVRRNNLQVVQSLLQYNCSVERQWQGPGGQSCSLLGVALRHGHVDMLSLLASVGAVCTADDIAEMATHIAVTDPTSLDVLHEVTSEPRSLQQLCRRTIRRHLSCNIRREVKSLPLPSRLQQYIVDV